MQQEKAALYLRSSKDRSDVSIDAQRRELQALAKSKGLAIVAEHTDVVISANDDDRPGFQALLAELKAPDRPWHAIKQKGLAGGRAPRGYELQHVTTGAVRKGTPVIKSILRLSAEAPIIARYLKGRAGGVCPLWGRPAAVQICS